MKHWSVKCVVFGSLSLLLVGCLPPNDERIADLSSEERERVCDRYNHEDVVCDDGREIDAVTKGECMDKFEYVAGSDCTFTVEDWKDLTSEPCSDQAANARSLQLKCAFSGF